VGRTDANDEGANGEAGDGVLDEVGGAGAEEGGRGLHLRIVVGGLEGFAGGQLVWVGRYFLSSIFQRIKTY
jgi:hypothetical protein